MMSEQLRPSPAKPWLHWHVYDPVRLVHVALGEHCACSVGLVVVQRLIARQPLDPIPLPCTHQYEDMTTRYGQYVNDYHTHTHLIAWQATANEAADGVVAHLCAIAVVDAAFVDIRATTSTKTRANLTAPGQVDCSYCTVKTTHQVIPTWLKPGKHWHVKLPGVLVHVA